MWSPPDFCTGLRRAFLRDMKLIRKERHGLRPRIPRASLEGRNQQARRLNRSSPLWNQEDRTVNWEKERLSVAFERRRGGIGNEKKKRAPPNGVHSSSITRQSSHGDAIARIREIPPPSRRVSSAGFISRIPRDVPFQRARPPQDKGQTGQTARLLCLENALPKQVRSSGGQAQLHRRPWKSSHHC